MDATPSTTTVAGEIDAAEGPLGPEGVPAMIARIMGGPAASVPMPARQEPRADPPVPDAPEATPAGYDREKAAIVLGVSPRRVSQLAAQGHLDVVQAKPLVVSAQSVEDRRLARRTANPQATVSSPEAAAAVARQFANEVDRIVALVVAENAKSTAVEARLLDEVSRQRDSLRAEVVRLRAELDAERRDRPDPDPAKPRTWKRR